MGVWDSLKELRKYSNQYLAAFTGTLLMLSVAAAYGWTSPTLPKLLADDSPLPLTPDESSWVVSILVLTSIAGPVLSAWLIDRFGRKPTLLIAVLPSIVGWVLIGVGDSVAVLFVSRALSGISYGMAYSSMPLYLGEIASDRIRGSIGTLLTVMAKTGILLEYSIGPYVGYTTLAWISIAFPAIFFGLFMWLPESPYYLLAKQRTELAEKNLRWLRRSNDVEGELKMMQAAVERSQQNRGTFRDLLNRGNRRSLIIILGLGALQQLCGSQAVIAYSQQIFDQVNIGLEAHESSIIMAVIQLVTAALSSSIVDRVGRRPLLLVSTVGCAVGTFIVGLYFFLVQQEVDLDGIGWIPLVVIMVYIIFYTVGLATVPFAILGEIFPANVKAVAVALYTMFAGAVGFGVSKLYQLISDEAGTYLSFWIFAACSAGFVVFVFALIPETKGKPLDQILIEMNTSTNRNINCFRRSKRSEEQKQVPTEGNLANA
ncbi:facilitated trehalose transporter Tret1-like [Anopheles bellator]|uniref:facilitated trehalose transporter Tret1-like n=1 Tax=Anopheles bellator TaxID=139047 RepID=UPI002648BF8E|nr:facilitated trehalose transporter Tret1-like [Anopheles bellator]